MRGVPKRDKVLALDSLSTTKDSSEKEHLLQIKTLNEKTALAALFIAQLLQYTYSPRLFHGNQISFLVEIYR